MRHAGNFNPEWGYVAPSPNFLRIASVFVVAAVIGAMASAAVVFSLTDRPVAETSVAARTLVQPVEPAAPLVTQPQTQSEQTSVSQTERGAMRPQGAAVVARGVSGSPAGAASTTPRPPIAPALAEAPRIMTTEAPPARALASELNTAAAPEAAPADASAAAPTPIPAPRAVVKKPRAVARAPAPRYDVPRYARRYGPRYDSMEWGRYASQYGSYGREY